jgi:hypothetical protein
MNQHEMMTSFHPLFKRKPYYNYTSKKADIDPVIMELRNNRKRGIARVIANQIQIPYTTLISW